MASIWYWHIGVSRGSAIENSIPHPINNNRRLFFLADGPHLLKNLKTYLVNNKLFIIEDVMHDNNINFSYVKIDHLKELLEIEENLIFKLSRKVKKDDLRNDRFNKMKVNKAKQILSIEISSSLKFIADQKDKKEYITTAWFIEVVSKWFSLITSRNPQVALGDNGTEKSHNAYTKAVQFLYSVIKLFENIKIGLEKSRNTKQRIFNTFQMGINNNDNLIYEFKPVQTGVLITTKSVIEITDYLLKEKINCSS